MSKQKLIICLCILGLFLPLSHVSAGTVLSSHKYAWSNNVGYINFENVIVGDSALSGYAWSANKGFIKFNPARGGVLNDGVGNLLGSAWGEQLGWIDFSNVHIDANGKFFGTATGTLVGTITFDCKNYCDVQTDWRKAITPIAPIVSVSNGGGGGLIASSPAIISTPIEAQNKPLAISSEQSSTVTKDTSSGQVTIDFLANKKPTFVISDEPSILPNEYLVSPNTKLVNGAFYDISAKDENGNYVHTFLNSIIISLPVPIKLASATHLGVYWLNETNQQWVVIPDAIFVNNKAIFKVDHLTKFAIFDVVNVDIVKHEKIPESLPIPPQKNPQLGNPPLFDISSQPVPLSEQSVTKGTRVDTNSAGLVAKVAPGELLPISVTLSNFGGGKRVDVLITYSIFTSKGDKIYSTSETVAVETTGNFVKTIQIPFGTTPGIYTVKTSIIYEGQLIPATTQFPFTVERKFFGLFQSDFLLYGGVTLLSSILMLALGHALIKRRRAQRFAPFDYSDIPHDKRTFYEILSDTVMGMRERVGDDALLIAAHIDGLQIDKETGRVLALTDRPSKIIATLVSEYEKLLGQRVSFSFRRENPHT